MKVKDYITERTMYDTLVNMVAVVSKKADWQFVNDVVSKAYGQKLLNQKQFKRLDNELKNIAKSL